MDYRLIIIGGGASGLAAAVRAAAGGIDGTAILEKLPRTDKKILATGNGRCNLSHSGITAADYYGSFDPAPVLDHFGDAADFFASMGLYTRTDEAGRMYPYSMTASAVLDALHMQLGGAQERCGVAVTGIRRISGGYAVSSDAGELTARNVIFAAGGHAAPKHGTDGSAWNILREMGIPVIPPRPILCPVKSDEKRLRPLKGLRVRCRVTLYDGDAAGYTEDGEVQFTETALSGICLFDLAGHIDTRRLHAYQIRLDLLPADTAGETLSRLYTMQGTRYAASCEEMLTGLLQRPLARLVLKQAGIRADAPCAGLDARQLQQLEAVLHDLRFPVTGIADFTQAQATAGGVRGDVLNANLSVRQYPGFYVTGEAVDVQSICGGYHLHWCWASGCMAADHIAGGVL